MIGGGQGTNVFWQVGSSATLGTTTSFVGDILALTSITLNTGANIACGAALAQNGAVTLDTNDISIGSLAPCTTSLLPPVVLPPAVAPIENADQCDLRQQPRPDTAGIPKPHQPVARTVGHRADPAYRRGRNGDAQAGIRR